MNDKCGLVDPANPCRCAKKTRGFAAGGAVAECGRRSERDGAEAGEDVAAMTHVEVPPRAADQPRPGRPAPAPQDFLLAEVRLGVFAIGAADESRVGLER